RGSLSGTPRRRSSREGDSRHREDSVGELSGRSRLPCFGDLLFAPISLFLPIMPPIKTREIAVSFHRIKTDGMTEFSQANRTKVHRACIAFGEVVGTV